MAKKKKAEVEEIEEDFENVPSELDETTHQEMLCVYREITDTIRFAKHLQWWTVGSTLLAFLAIMVVAKYINHGKGFIDALNWVTLILSGGVILTLVIYQFWQHNELMMIREVGKNMSSLFRRVRGIKSRREGTIHRYFLLVCMIVTVCMGAIVTLMALSRF